MDTIVLRVNNGLFKQIADKPYVFINLKKVMFKPFFKLVQCFNCATFGHLANKCQAESACPT